MDKITRRHFLRNTAAAGAGAVAPAQAAAAGPDQEASLRRLNELIDAHARAVAVDKAEWDRVAEASEAIEGNLPICRVQVGRMLGMRDAQGNDNYTPIYSYSAEDIERRTARDIEIHTGFYAHGPLAAERAQAVRDKWTTWSEKKKAELAALRAERQRIEDQSGYSAALAAGRASTETVKDIEKDIVDLVPNTIEAAAAKAAWCVHAFREDSGSFLAEAGEDTLLAILEAIGRART